MMVMGWIREGSVLVWQNIFGLAVIELYKE